MAAAESIEKPSAAMINKERISRRQERFSRGIHEYVQHVLLTETDTCRSPYFLDIGRVQVAPDLRRARVFWTLYRMDQELGKSVHETKMMKAYLESITKWMRFKVTQHMGSKYSAVIEFRHEISTTNPQP